jgi:hypothetical protein
VITIDAELRRRVEGLFAPLQNAAANSFPPIAALSTKLKEIAPSNSSSINVRPEVVSLFATAAVEMWLRAVHSFIVSAALTEDSPIWSSVSGYYSSHYTIRGFAHLLGYFKIHSVKKVVELEQQRGGRHVCKFQMKGGDGREHRLYWQLVKQNPHFQSDPFFTENPAQRDWKEIHESDAGHRERANYADHVSRFPVFHPLKEDVLKRRIAHISKVVCDAPPIPKPLSFPDVDSVQLVAYHRLVKFRRFVDEVIGTGNRFWKKHRSPSWVNGFVDFQLVDQDSLAVPVRGD